MPFPKSLDQNFQPGVTFSGFPTQLDMRGCMKCMYCEKAATREICAGAMRKLIQEFHNEEGIPVHYWLWLHTCADHEAVALEYSRFL